MASKHKEAAVHNPIAERVPFLYADTRAEAAKMADIGVSDKKNVVPEVAARRNWVLATAVLLLLSLFGVLEGNYLPGVFGSLVGLIYSGPFLYP